MTADGYQPENWQWFEVLTEPSPNRVDSKGQPRRIGRDPMTLPVEVLTASGHGPREARRVIGALGDEPVDSSIRRLTELRRHCLACAENAAEVRRCSIIDCPLWPYRMGKNPHNPRRGINPFQPCTRSLTVSPIGHHKADCLRDRTTCCEQILDKGNRHGRHL